MGRSKFPGKPSKLVTKKRVSVLNGNANAIQTANHLVNGAAGQQSSLLFNSTNHADQRPENVSNNSIELDGDIGLRTTANHTKCADAGQVMTLILILFYFLAICFVFV